MSVSSYLSSSLALKSAILDDLPSGYWMVFTLTLLVLGFTVDWP
jgi:hypothetical protein